MIFVSLTVFLPAAFGRLCVETITCLKMASPTCPAAFGRLCVETIKEEARFAGDGPAAFGRLCVETPTTKCRKSTYGTSRLRAAVC